MTRKLGLFVTGFALMAGLPAAQAQVYKVTLIGANEIPPVVTPGSGSAIITLNSKTHEMRVAASFTGLIGNTTASHVHCCVAQPGAASVATTTPTFPGTPLGVTSGSWDRTYDMTQTGAWNAPFLAANGGTPAGAEAAFIAGVAANQAYLNIHSSTFTGGEIRGFFVLNKFAANTGLSAGAQGAAAALDSLGAGTGALSDALVTLAGMGQAQQAAALEKVTPNASRGARLAVSESVTAAFDQVSNRLDGLRLADGSQAVLAALGSAPAQTDNGFWLAGNGVNSRQSSKSGFAGYKNSGWGLAGGLDRRLEPGRYIGASVNYSDSSLKYRNQSAGDSTDITSTQVSVYGTQDAGAVYLDGMAAYGWQKYDNSRNTGVSGKAVSSFDGRVWGARVGGGMPIAMSPNASITPQIHLDWDSIKQDSYKESGGGPLALSVGSGSADRFRSSIGGQIDFASDMGDLKMRPFLRAFWHHNFSNDGIDASASFVSGGNSFVVPGQKLDANPYTLGAGINLYSQGSFTAALAYDGTFAKSYHSHAYQAKARWTF